MRYLQLPEIDEVNVYLGNVLDSTSKQSVSTFLASNCRIEAYSTRHEKNDRKLTANLIQNLPNVYSGNLVTDQYEELMRTQEQEAVDAQQELTISPQILPSPSPVVAQNNNNCIFLSSTAPHLGTTEFISQVNYEEYATAICVLHHTYNGERDFTTLSPSEFTKVQWSDVESDVGLRVGCHTSLLKIQCCVTHLVGASSELCILCYKGVVQYPSAQPHREILWSRHYFFLPKSQRKALILLSLSGESASSVPDASQEIFSTERYGYIDRNEQSVSQKTLSLNSLDDWGDEVDLDYTGLQNQ